MPAPTPTTDTERLDALERDAVFVAAVALVERLSLIHHDVRYLGVWQCAQVHLGPYTGPKYEAELAALRQAIDKSLLAKEGV